MARKPRDYKAEYRARVEKAKRLGFPSYYQRRKVRQLERTGRTPYQETQHRKRKRRERTQAETLAERITSAMRDTGLDDWFATLDTLDELLTMNSQAFWEAFRIWYKKANII